VSKHFGPRRAIDDVSLYVPPGTCFGFLGPNGAGKTTLIRMILGLARPSAGSIVVRGHSLATDAREALAGVGGIVEEPVFYPYLTGRANLGLWARVEGGQAPERVPAALARVGLAGREDDAVKGYSMGMRQRLGVARALLSDPELLVLDEPSNGLDPEGIAEFRQMIRSFVTEGRTVFISSHLLDEIEKICDDVAIVRDGRVIAAGPVDQVIGEGHGGGGVRIRVDDPARARAALEEVRIGSTVTGGDDGAILVQGVTQEAEVAALVRALVGADVAVYEVGAPLRVSLEERFLELMRTPSPPPAPARGSGR